MKLLLLCASMWVVPAAAQLSSSEPPDVHRVEHALDVIREVYLTPVAEAVLIGSCKTGMREQLAKGSPPAQLPEVRSSMGAPAIDEIRDLLAEVKIRQPRDFERKMVDACLRAMVTNLDPRSAYFDAEEFTALQPDTPRLSGVGLELKIENEFPTVVASLEGSPASRSDLAAGDVILNIDGVPTRGMARNEAVRRLRGKPKSTVILTIRRAGVPEPIRRELTREIVQLQTVASRTTPEGYLYIRLTQFQEITIDQLARVLKAAYDDGAKTVPGIIVDLRDNPGGVLHAVVGVAAAFLPGPELVVEYKGRSADQSRRMHAVPRDYRRSSPVEDPLRDLPEAAKKVPLVVIINSRSVAGAEIVAAALQDHRRARLIGERTSGTGTLQTFIPASELTALKLTTAKMYRPSGEAIDGNPVTPDVRLSGDEAARPPGSAEDVALQRARALLRQNFP